MLIKISFLTVLLLIPLIFTSSAFAFNYNVEWLNVAPTSVQNRLSSDAFEANPNQYSQPRYSDIADEINLMNSNEGLIRNTLTNISNVNIHLIRQQYGPYFFDSLDDSLYISACEKNDSNVAVNLCTGTTAPQNIVFARGQVSFLLGHLVNEQLFNQAERTAFLALINEYTYDAKGKDKIAMNFTAVFGSPQARAWIGGVANYKVSYCYWKCMVQDLINPDFINMNVPNRTKGDVNNDGVINDSDLLEGLSSIWLDTTLTEENFGPFWSGDVNYDGDIDYDDLMIIMDMY